MADIDNNQNAENTQLPAEFNDSTEMNLADMLSALIESTIAADQKAAEDYLDVLRTYALEPANGSNGHERLKMVDFEMTDSNGREQIVSIPKLSLLPLPLLRVAEATFDIEAQIDISTATKQDVEKFEENYPIYNQKKKTSIDDLSKEEQEILLKKIKSLAGIRVRLGNQRTPKKRNPLLRSGKTTTNETTSMQKMTNVKVHIKLEPVLLPDGMRGLLQARTLSRWWINRTNKLITKTINTFSYDEQQSAKDPRTQLSAVWSFHSYIHPRTALFKRTSLYALRSDTHYKPQRIETCDGDTEKRKRCTAKPEQGKFFPTINTIDYGRWT